MVTRVVIIVSVATYAWLQKKDRDGPGGVRAMLSNPDNAKLLALAGALAGALALLLAIGYLLAGDPNPSG